MGVYGATKRGLDYFTTALARELKATPVLVGKVRPGLLLTEGVVREARADPATFARSRRMLNVLCDQPDTVAPFLLSRMLSMHKTGGRIAWLSGRRIAGRMLMDRIRPRADQFEAVGL
jgi:short-subunit dehydrogenase